MIDLKDILAKHQKWLNDEPGGVRANLTEANLTRAALYGANLTRAALYGAALTGADLTEADLTEADLTEANLTRANLTEANLTRAALYGADLTGADLTGADLTETNLTRANLTGADLTRAALYGANLRGADLTRANLTGADLYGADLTEANLYGAVNAPYIPMACPDEGDYTAYKAVRDGYIVVLHIPADARRSSASGRKCRADKAEVVRIENFDGSVADVEEVFSIHDGDFSYKCGATVSVEDFDPDRWTECAPGIHHFMNRKEATKYYKEMYC